MPVLATEANGVNLGLKLADGTELHFASTARLTTFVYSVAVQQMQATQFVTDNRTLDIQHSAMDTNDHRSAVGRSDHCRNLAHEFRRATSSDG